MTKYYMKELSESPVYINGFPLRFDVLETSDPTLITELDNCVNRQVGGVIALSKEQYDAEVKKKESGLNSRGNSKLRQNRQELTAIHNLAGRARAVDLVANPAQRPGGSVFAQRQQPSGDRYITKPEVALPDPIEVPSPLDFQVKQPTKVKLSDLIK